MNSYRIFRVLLFSAIVLIRCTRDEIVFRDYSDTTHITLYKIVSDTDKYIRYHHLVDTTHITDTLTVYDTIVVYDTIH